MFGIFFPFGDGRRVIVTGRSTIDRAVKTLSGPTLVVGFHDPGSLLPPWPNDPNIVDKVIIEAHDLDRPPSGLKFVDDPDDDTDFILFSPEHAKQIQAMYQRNHVYPAGGMKCGLLNTHIEFVFQCEAGLSRSAASAAATVRWLGGDDTIFFQARYPNHRIYSFLLRTLMGLDPEIKEW